MTEQNKKVIALGGAFMSLAMLASTQGAAFAADAPQEMPENTQGEAVQAKGLFTAAPQQPARVAGFFSFTQGVAADAATVKAALARAGEFLCGSDAAVVAAAGEQETEAHGWPLAVGGAVDQPIVGTFDELAEEVGVQEAVMGCSCAGNPIDGGASATAKVAGLNTAELIALSAPSEEANTAVFTSADGYEVALPLSYLEHRYCPLVFAVADAPLAESVGGVNQLWLGSTPARYFVRNVVSITVECREAPPAAPGTAEAGDSYANLPNVGVAFGGEVA